MGVIGIGVSNRPLIRMLRDAGIDVTAYDKSEREKLGDVAKEMDDLGVKLVLGPDYLDRLQGDVIFRTPGLHADIPALTTARSKGIKVTSEMEVFLRVCPCKTIGITGSDGKTTTTTLIGELLKAAGYTVHVGGNIGKPLLPEVDRMKPDDIAVLELSSFQLMDMTRSPDIAVVTNISQNHMDVHKSMEEYIAAKENILCHQHTDDLAVLNGDNDTTREFASQAIGRAILFSRLRPQPEGVDIENGVIRYMSKDVLPVEDILLPGVHNVENYMAAIGAVGDMVDGEIIRQTAKNFAGVEHRIELVRTLDGVRYYNDSIASSPTRTIAGLHSFDQKVILIAGGYDKKIPYAELGEEIVEHVSTLCLTGATAGKIREAVESADGYEPGHPEIIQCDDFTSAVLAARDAAKPGDVVILSPACASFDQFKNFEERGRTFKDIVNGLT